VTTTTPTPISRLREISGAGEGDAFRAVLWANYFAAIGDRRRAADERAYLARARQTLWPPTEVIVYLDYAFWLFLASAGGLLFVYLAVTIRAGWWLLRRLFEPRVIRAMALAVATLFGARTLAALPPSSPMWLPAALLLLCLAHLGLLAFLPLILSTLRSCRKHLGAAGLRRTLVAGLRWCGVALLPPLVLGVSLAALSFAIRYFGRTQGPLDLSDLLERPVSEADDPPPEERFDAALVSHGSGDFRRARRLYASLPDTPPVRRNLRALARGLPPLAFDHVPTRPRVDLPGLAREWLQNESWQPWRAPYEIRSEFQRQRQRWASLLDAFSAPVVYYVATHAGARIALQASPLALLALLLRPVRRSAGRALAILLPGAGFLRRRQVARAYGVLWLFLFAAGPACWLLLARSQNPDFVDVFGPHAGAGYFSSQVILCCRKTTSPCPRRPTRS
jgi:hypothetical protein